MLLRRFLLNMRLLLVFCNRLKFRSCDVSPKGLVAFIFFSQVLVTFFICRYAVVGENPIFFFCTLYVHLYLMQACSQRYQNSR